MNRLVSSSNADLCTADAIKDIYGYDKWGEGYFHVNGSGSIEVTPSRDGKSIDLYEVVKTLVSRGIAVPILVRFDGIIRDRFSKIYTAFQEAVDLYNYKSEYRHIFPIKVNQQKHVINSVRIAGLDRRSGLEVGSKPELLALLNIPDDCDSLFLCNGYKDEEYIELALLSKKLGRRTIIIIEQVYECQLIIDVAERLGMQAEVGFRMKPESQGSGRWSDSGGDFAKFGLSTHEMLCVCQKFVDANKGEWIKLLHFHIGSQLNSILPFKKTLAEAARFYTELAAHCTALEFFDVGGGLGVDYEGTKAMTDSSMNYTIEEYARDVVYIVGNICDEMGISHPVLITESGRALVAHHSILITEVIDVAKYNDSITNLLPPPSDSPMLLDLYEMHETLSADNYLEALHDADYIKHQVLEKFIHGGITLKERAYMEQTYRSLIVKINRFYVDLKDAHDDVEKLSKQLVDTYFCNFSVFQSLPDTWAINQLFPIMPIHRLDTTPTRKAKIVDISCDSDGTIKNFISPNGPATSLPLHKFNMEEPYYIGIFLVGAYQEALGSLHNLFGDTNAIHVDVHEDGSWRFKNLIEGDTIREVLQYMQYDADSFTSHLHYHIESALRKQLITNSEALAIKKKYKASFDNYTYLVG